VCVPIAFSYLRVSLAGGTLAPIAVAGIE